LNILINFPEQWSNRSMALATALHHWKIKSDGFQVISPMVSPECLNELREANNRLMTCSAKGYRLLGGLTKQVMEPNLDDPVYEANEAIEAGIRFAQSELGWSKPVKTYSQLLFKPSHHPHETSWHQDIAYLKHPFTRAGYPVKNISIQFWLSLDGAHVDSGCMHFIPGGRDTTLPHHVVSGDPNDDSRLLAINDPSTIGVTEAVPCPLPAGSASVYTEEGTLHFTPANASDRPRRAYIFNLVDSNA
jgi:hypothetical protein